MTVDWSILGRDMAITVTLMVSLYVVSWHCVPERFKNKVQIMDLFFSVPYYFVLSYLAITGTIALNSGIYSHFHETTSSSYLCSLLYVSGNLVHVPITFMKDQSRTYKLQLLLHHVLSITCFGTGLCFMRMHFFIVLSACCEVSTFFLNNVFLFKEFNFSHTIQLINGILLWVTYLLSRIILFPVWLYIFYTETSINPEGTWDQLNFLERYLSPFSTLLVLGLSCLWFVSITKGFIKVVKGSKLKQEKKG